MNFFNWDQASGVMIILMILGFVAIVAWAYSRKRQRRFEEAAQLALDEEDRDIAVEDMEKRE